MEESVSTFKSVLEAEQRNGKTQKNRLMVETENPISTPNKEQGVDQAIKIRKEVEVHPITVGVEARANV